MAEFQILETILQATIIHHRDEDGKIWASRGRKIICNEGGKWQTIAKFPFAVPRDLFGFFRPLARVLRSDKCNLFRNQLGNMIGIRNGWVYEIRNGSLKKLLKINGDCVLHGSICEDDLGNIFFGEYFMNPDRIPVRIWRVSADLKKWQPAAELDFVRHVHGIYQDSYHPKTYWVTVGDFESECYLLKTEDNFKTIKKIGDGSQIWRAVRLFFTKNYICWLTDSHVEQNFACRMNRQTRKIEIGQQLDASVWYGCQTKEGAFIAFTTIERGPAIQSDISSVLVSRDGFLWEKVAGFKKDFWRPVQVFKYGVISCPSGEMHNEEIYLSGEGLVGLDGISIRARIDLKG